MICINLLSVTDVVINQFNSERYILTQNEIFEPYIETQNLVHLFWRP